MSALDRPDQEANGPIDDVDVATLGEIREMYDLVDPMPPGLVTRVQFALELEEAEFELARICEESRLVGVRSIAEETRTITFDSAVLTVMISLRPVTEDRVRVDGWLAPAGEHRVEFRLPDEKRQTVSDAQGRFVVDDVPRGRLQIVVRLSQQDHHNGSAPVVVTPAVEI
ncbi:hypothetical protein Afil01_08980 [Actinorhabdospora filicis]|uniref:Carboxypeptidase regulatory-like domain-containing protein n=1 Tax=Actinorhabdospora filicis TaxID=1785913 RepID=A0A9W6SK45_9ACTN|nr:hypothetical protein [Actinorhabdospora filicis]GLZ76091.1 hypothetical protein Afil01_08980 [Actinorhabdospora filicis]